MHMAGNDEARLGLRQQLGRQHFAQPEAGATRASISGIVKYSSNIFGILEVVYSIEFSWYF